MWSNLIAIRVDTQLKNGFGFQLLFRQRVSKLQNYKNNTKSMLLHQGRGIFDLSHTCLQIVLTVFFFFNWFEIKTSCYPNYMIKILYRFYFQGLRNFGVLLLGLFGAKLVRYYRKERFPFKLRQT